MLTNDRLLRALLRQPVDRTPVWLMRQAGRYLPEYRELRKKVANFMAFCQTPELACQATLQPLARFDLDAAIIFSDILTVPAAMGMQVEISATKGPILSDPIRSLRMLDNLITADIVERLAYVMQTIRLVRQELNNTVPLIGFAGSPWTLACYVVEGFSSRTFNTVRTMLYREPKLLHLLLAKLTTATITYLDAQIMAGAHAIMLFDTWGGLLTKQTYQEFSLSYMTQIATAIRRRVAGKTIPLIFFTKNAGSWLEIIADSGCDAVSLDWTVDLADARERVGSRVALQGNLDPVVLFAEPARIRLAVKEVIDCFGPNPGHVFNLGHGIDKNTPPASVAAMVAAVQEFGTI